MRALAPPAAPAGVALALALVAGLLPLPAAAAAPPAPDVDRDLAGLEVLVAREVPGPLAPDPAAPLWEAIPPLRVALAPQRTVRLSDRRANAALGRPGPAAVEVRAATDGTDLALLLDWADPSEDRGRGDETDRFGDAAAIQLPLRFGAGQRLPYVGMGDEAQPVALHLLRAAAEGTAAREAVAAGFGSSTRADLGGGRGALRRDAARGRWRAVLVRPLAGGPLDLRAGIVPVAFAVWDGGRAERSGNKALSGWKVLRLPPFPADPAYAAELAAGRGPGARGDAARGKALVNGLCAGCHHAGDRRVARPGLAPDLTGIGVIAAPAYLRESIVTPGAVVVPGRWARPGPGGAPASTMPAYATLPAADVDAMVAYLMTLGAEAPEPGSRP